MDYDPTLFNAFSGQKRVFAHLYRNPGDGEVRIKNIYLIAELQSGGSFNIVQKNDDETIKWYDEDTVVAKPLKIRFNNLLDTALDCYAIVESPSDKGGCAVPVTIPTGLPGSGGYRTYYTGFALTEYFDRAVVITTARNDLHFYDYYQNFEYQTVKVSMPENLIAYFIDATRMGLNNSTITIKDE